MSRPDDDGYDFVFQQLSKNLVDGIISVVKLFPDSDVAQVDDAQLGPVVEKRIEGFPDEIHTIGAAFVVDRAAFFLDTEKSQIHAFEVGEIILIAIDSDGFALGLLAWTEGLAETLLSNGFKEKADVHFLMMNDECGMRNVQVFASFRIPNS